VTAKSTGPGGNDLLVIGYGNELRCDDGVGPKVAIAVAEWNLAGVRALVCHQLTPELADPIAAARRVVFVDAAADSSQSVELRRIEPADAVETMTHATNPRSLLRLATQVFGRCPPAWWLTVPVSNLGFGEELSPQAREGLRTALDKIRDLAGQEL
jgi:hydrogenase maturation protease